MSTRTDRPPRTERVGGADLPNGAALAAFVAAGIGSFAVGLFVILSEIGVFSAPTLYEPAGGVSGRTTFAIVAWFIAWAVLHFRWRDREIEGGGAFALTLALVALAAIATFPLAWGLFG